ncbi:MAG TPA: FecR family protein, partial [Chitinivibrionales bacterium]
MKPMFWKKIAIFMFVCFSLCEAASKEIVATIDSLVGKAEIQKSAQQQWRPAKVGNKLNSGDVIRALDNSFICVSWPDGNISYIHANSQIQLNFFDSSQPDVVTTHITVLYGAIFFVIKEILPKALTKTYDTKVYTPTAVVSVRGTGFAVEVNNKSGETGVTVINGTVLVRNIIKDAPLFLSAGFKTKVAMKTDPIVAVSLPDEDITGLKSWVPAFIIDKEMSEQLARAKREHDVLSGDFKDKTTIVPFTNKSKYKGTWALGLVMAQQLADQLGQSNKNVVVAEPDSGMTDPLSVGLKYQTRFVIIGDVVDFDILQHAEISAAADEYKEYYIATVKLSVQLIGMSEKKILADHICVGETQGKNIKENAWQKIGKLSFNLKDPRFSHSILGNSTQQALDQAAEKIIQTMNVQ